MNTIKIFFVVLFVITIYACQPSAVRETVEPHPVTEEGLIASSLYAAERVGSDDVMANMLRRISLLKVRQDQFDTALEFADQIPTQSEKDRTIADIAIAINDQGERGRARSIAAQIESDYEKSRVLAEIAVAYERAEEYRQGRELAEEITDPNFKARAIAEIAVVYQEAGYGDLASRLFNQALTAARTEQSITHHIETLLFIAEQYYEAGRQQGARDVFADALRLADDVRLEQHVVSVWGNFLTSYRKAGQDNTVIEHALTAARDMGEAEGYYRDELLSRIAIALAHESNYDRAQSVTGDIEDAPLRATTYSRLAVIAHNRNDTEEAGGLLNTAVEVSGTMSEGTFKQRAMRDIAIHAVEMHQYDTVDRLLDKIDEPQFAADAASLAADTALEEDDEDAFNRYLKKTVAAFDIIEDPVVKSEILFSIAELYERSGYTPDEDTKLIVSKALHAVD